MEQGCSLEGKSKCRQGQQGSTGVEVEHQTEQRFYIETEQDQLLQCTAVSHGQRVPPAANCLPTQQKDLSPTPWSLKY